MVAALRDWLRFSCSSGGVLADLCAGRGAADRATPGRRRLLHACLAAGAAVGGYLFWGLLTLPHGAALREGHIVYFTKTRQSNLVAILSISPRRRCRWRSVHGERCKFSAQSYSWAPLSPYVSYWEAFVSVWCFFAAVASATILFHFERSRRTRISSAVA